MHKKSTGKLLISSFFGAMPNRHGTLVLIERTNVCGVHFSASASSTPQVTQWAVLV